MSHSSKNRSKRRIDYSIRDIEKLQDLYFQNYTALEIGIELKRTASAIATKIKELKLPQEKNYHWTEEDCQFLKDNFNKMSTPELAKILNRSINSIYKKHERLLKEIKELEELKQDEQPTTPSNN